MLSVPGTFRAMPRWWHDVEGRDWLDRLPGLVEQQCARWRLEVDGTPLHGSNALVVPVRQGTHEYALRLCPPADDLTTEITALRHWAGHEVVGLHEADPSGGALLLERLDPDRSLTAVPPLEAAGILGGLTRRLAIPAPPSAPSTRDIAAQEASAAESRWEALGRPLPRTLLEAAIAAAGRRAAPDPGGGSADGDLHHEQVLAGRRHPWTVVDPVLLRGDREYDLGRVLWSRLDELPGDEHVRAVAGAFVESARVPTERARDWVLVRSLSYLLWGLEHDLTLDPPRCRRLLEVFA